MQSGVGRDALGGTHLIHKDVKDPGGNRQGEGGEEKCEEPGRRIHRCVEALGSEVGVQVRKLLLCGDGEAGGHGEGGIEPQCLSPPGSIC